MLGARPFLSSAKSVVQHWIHRGRVLDVKDGDKICLLILDMLGIWHACMLHMMDFCQLSLTHTPQAKERQWYHGQKQPSYLHFICRTVHHINACPAAVMVRLSRPSGHLTSGDLSEGT